MPGEFVAARANLTDMQALPLPSVDSRELLSVGIAQAVYLCLGKDHRHDRE
jgi:hypothetical protein